MSSYSNITKVLHKIRSNRLVLNAAFNSGSFVAISFATLILTPFVVTNLTLEVYGIYILLTSMYGYYGVFDLGLGQGLVKFVSEYQVSKDHQHLHRVINSILWAQCSLASVMSFLLYYFAADIGNMFNVSPHNYSDTIVALRFSAIGFFFSMISATFSSVITGLQRYDITSITDSSITIGLNIAILIISFFQYGLLGVIVLTVLSSIISCSVYYWIVRSRLPQYRVHWQFDGAILRKFLTFSSNIFLSKISNIFANYIVRFVISFFLGPIAVAYYVIPSKLLGAYGGVMSSAVGTLYPFTSGLVALGQRNEIKPMALKASSLFVAIALPLSLFISFFSKEILSLWMGEAFADQSWMVLTILCVSSTIGGVTAVPNVMIMGMGNSRLIGLFSMMTILLYILFLPVLTYYYGIVGAGISLLLTSSIIVWFVIQKTNHYFEISFTEYWNTVWSIHTWPTVLYMSASIMVLHAYQMQGVASLFVGGTMTLAYLFFLFTRGKLIH